ncbi:MAG: M20/M25/M40 family metallo-hydrolase [Pseudomonadota bacterium]
MRARALLLLALTASLAACVSAPLNRVTPAEREAMAARMMVDIETLASDEFEGRKPGTQGGQRTLDYLTQRFAEVGLTSGTNDPGNPWRAPVALTSVRADTSRIEFILGDETITLTEAAGVAVTTRQRELIAEGDLVFVGYEAETVAPERVMGKVVIMLADDSLNPERRVLLESKQANAVIVVAQSPRSVADVRAESGREILNLTGDIDEVFAAVATNAAMARVFGAQRWEAWTKAAGADGFNPIDLDAKANIEASAQRRDFVSYNILGRVAGAQPDTKAVLLLAHWDHLGLCRPEGAPDRICNGAVDNASGVALMLELARRLADAGPFERDIYVLATTAEEAGLLGAKAFAANPPVPLKSVVGAFNFDSVALAPAGSPVGFVGEGRTALDPLVLEELLAAGRDLGSRDYAERFVQRQDAWALLQKGVPAVMLSSAFASEITAGPFFVGDYHSPGDEVAGIELGGAVDDLLLHEKLVKRLAIPVAETASGQR